VDRLSATVVALALVAAPATAAACSSSSAALPPPQAFPPSWSVPVPLLPPDIVPPGAPVAATAKLPSEVIDLKNWYLTLPSGNAGKPDDVFQPQLATYGGKYFKLNDTRDGVVFTANAGGVTTKNSSYPRSELREMSGGNKASWSNLSGTHTLRVRQAVKSIPSAKPEVVTAQIHDASDDVMEIRLEGRQLIAQYDDGKSNIPIDPSYRLGTPYDLKIVAAGGRIQVFYNGVKKADIAKSGSGWYFKTGSYLQSNTTKGDAAGAIGEVVLYALDVTHSG
jgi:hypothetical protein